MSESTNPPDRPDSSGVDEPSRNFLENPQLYDLFKSAIRKEVDAAVHQKLEGFRNRTVKICTIMAILIAVIPAIGWYWLDDRIETASKTAIEEKVDKAAEIAVKKIVDKAVKTAIDEEGARFEARVATLNFRALRTQIEKRFDADEIESIITTIGMLYDERDDADRRDKLIFAVETAAESSSSADRPDLLFRLEGKAPKLFHGSERVLQIMIQTQGRRLLGDAGAPESWLNKTGPMKAVYDSYRSYADKGRNEGYPGYYTAYELLLRHLARQPEEELRNLIADAERLNDNAQANFVNIMINLAKDERTRRPYAESERVTHRVRTFLCKFKQEPIIKLISLFAKPQCP